MKGFIVLFLMAISVIYIINPGAGVIEIIPDNFPFIGNLDEAGAVTLLLMCFRYFGIDITKIFEKGTKRKEIGEV